MQFAFYILVFAFHKKALECTNKKRYTKARQEVAYENHDSRK